jgi:hypothetical protein
MKKVFKWLSLALVVVACMLAFVGCDKSGSIKSAYEDAGYTVSTIDKDNSLVKSIISSLSDEQKKEVENCEIIYAIKVSLTDGGSAFVFKFASSGDLKSFLTTDDGDDSAYKTAQEDEVINGNCYLISATGGAKEIFKKA